MEQIEIKVKPRLSFSLKKCGDTIGIQGEKGDKGIQGIQGIQGEKGDKGDAGTTLHTSLTEKNSDPSVQHVDTTTVKPTLAAADMVAIKDSVTGKVVLTPKTQFAMTAQEAWITPTLLNGWVNEGYSLKYMKDEFGFVHIQGLVSGTTASTIIFQLPVGYRPSTNGNYLVFFAPNRASINASMAIRITDNGNVAGMSAAIFVGVNITFKAEQ